MHTLFIYLKSFLDFIFLIVLRYFYSFRNTTSSNLLFINTGQIGDLIVSSSLFEHDILFNDNSNCFFLIDENFRELFENYKGKIKIIGLNIRSYKYNPLYRIRLHNKLFKLNISTVYNLTSERTTWNDTLALTVGAPKIYCYENRWKTLKKVLKKQTDNFYTEQIAVEYFNEYDRINYVIEKLGNNAIPSVTNTTLFRNENTKSFDIIIAPFSSIGNRDIKLNYIKSLSEVFNDCNFLILSSFSQKEKLKGIETNNITISAGEYKLSQLYSVINKSKIFIGVDSGLTHIALKTKTKVIAVTGLGNYKRYLPKPGNNNAVYLYDDCKYANCEWFCKKEKVFCVENVSVNRLIEEVNIAMGNYENS